jgi:hypothetical protein
MKQYEVEVERTVVERYKVWVSAPNKRMAERFVRITSRDNDSDDDLLTDGLLDRVSVDEDGDISTREKLRVRAVASYDV